MEDDTRRALPFPGLLNARDLGGYPIAGGARTRWRSLLRSDDLARLTPAGLQLFGAHGIETIIDLRWPVEIAESPSPVSRHLRHIRYEQVSLLGPSPDAWVARSQGYSKEQWKCAVLEHVRAELAHVLKLIAGAPPGPLLFHCVAGKDRTGLIAALLLALADVEPGAIAHDYSLSGENLREHYLRGCARDSIAEIIESVRCPAEGAHNMLKYLEAAGGVHQYLKQIGLEPDEIKRLRTRL
jgi:protein-tyrosine phosphatase